PGHRHAIPVCAGLVHGDAVVGVRQHLAERVHLEPRGVPALDLALQADAEAGNAAAQPVRAVRWRPGEPELDAETPQEVAPVAVSVVEAWHVDVAATVAPIVLRRRAGER